MKAQDFSNEFILLKNKNIMAWDQESLWAKASLFMERAFDQQDDDAQFGLWAAFGLELLARSAVSAVSPTLLAEPDPSQKNLLHALERVQAKPSAQSIAVTKVFDLCKVLFDELAPDDITNSKALINRRNEELHTGEAAFEDYPTDKWLVGFHRVCSSLCKVQGKLLAEFYGQDEAAKAEEMLAAANAETKGRIKHSIESHKHVFSGKTEEEQKELISKAKKTAEEQSWRGLRIAKCPACGALGNMIGESYGKETVTLDEDDVIIKRAMIPRSFKCHCCGLQLRDIGELDAAGLGGRFSNSSRVEASEYFGLIDPKDVDGDPYMDE